MALRLSRSGHAMALPSRTQTALSTCLNALCFALIFIVELQGAWVRVLTGIGVARLTPHVTNPG
jgi:hypothetical protein